MGDFSQASAAGVNQAASVSLDTASGASFLFSLYTQLLDRFEYAYNVVPLFII